MKLLTAIGPAFAIGTSLALTGCGPSDEVIYKHLASAVCTELEKSATASEAGQKAGLAHPQYQVQMHQLVEAGTFHHDFVAVSMDMCPESFERSRRMNS